MHFLTPILALATVLGAAPTALSVPYRGPQFPLDFLRLCPEPNFAGRCVTAYTDNEDCHDLPGDLNDVTRSAITGAFVRSCSLFIDYGCNGPSIDVGKAGNADFGGTVFDKQVSAFRCTFGV